MILTDLDHLLEQIPHMPQFVQAVEFLQRSHASSSTQPTGRVELEDGLFAMFQAFQTLPVEAARYEAHRKYIDIQYIVEGEELMGWVHTDGLPVAEAYNLAKEAWFGAPLPGTVTFLHLRAGQLVVFFPTDAHAPMLSPGAPANVRKIVIKVPVS